MSWLSAIGSLGSLATSVSGMFGKKKKPKGYKDMKKALKLQQQYAAALAGGESNALFKSRTNETEKTIQSDFLNALKMAQQQEAENRAMGSMPLMANSERRDESFMRALMEGNEQSREIARERVRADLGNALGAQQQIGSGYESLYNLSKQQQDENRAMNAGGYQSIFSALGSLGNMLGKSNTGTSSSSIWQKMFSNPAQKG